MNLGGRPQKPNSAADFWSKVQKGDGCWLWSGRCNPKGYGQQRWSGRNVGAHRIAWELSGRALLPSEWLLHSCDVPRCVNPAHLRIGNAKDNVQDMYDRDRAMRGSRHKKAKLAEGQVAEILARLEMGANRADLAREFRVSWDLIDRIKRGVCWKHVPRTPVDLSPSSGKPRAAPPKAVEVSDPPTERK